MSKIEDTNCEPKLEDFPVRYVEKPEKRDLSTITVDAGIWSNGKKRFKASCIIGGILFIICVTLFLPHTPVTTIWIFLGLYVVDTIIIGPIVGCVIWVILSIIGDFKESKLKEAAQESQYEADLRHYYEEKKEAEKMRAHEFAEAHHQWEERQKQIQREKEAQMLEEKQKKELKAKIQREEEAADIRMAQSTLVSEIARCMVPYFKKTIDKADRETHMKVRVRLAVNVRKESIDYYDVSDEKNICHFVFSEEGISEKLTPIMRKALCKALSTELRRLILESYPIDPNGQKVQVGLENMVRLESSITYVPGRDYTAPEYDDNSYATVTLLYETFEQKTERYF